MTEEPRDVPPDDPVSIVDAPGGDAAIPDADFDAARARRWHERSGEIELLISGALVFGLFQLPPYLDRVADGLLPTLSLGQFVVAFMLSFYVQLIVLTLIAAFSLHLVTRAYWVGLIGLDSVFPDGIHWDRVKYGPVAKQVYEERVPRLATMIRRADDFGSSIFSFAFWMSVLFVWSIVVGSLFGAIWYVGTLLFSTELEPQAFLAVLLAIVLLPSLAILVDKTVTLDPDGRAAAVVRRVVAGAYWVTGGPIFMPIQFTLFSRVPKKVIWPLFLGVFSVLIAGFSFSEVWSQAGSRLSANAFYPERPGIRTLSDDYYAASRSETSTAPYIQSRVIEGRYVELTVPLVPMRDRRRLEAACPDLEPATRTGLLDGPDLREPPDTAYERELLRCMGRIWTLYLDARPLPAEWDLEWSERFGPRALVAYLRADTLSVGPHVLEVRRAPAPLDEAEVAELEAEGEAPPGPVIHYIRFRR